jgi:hypothetical protein
MPAKARKIGVERGTYLWDQATGAFSVKLAVDTNGESGLSHPKGPMSIAVINDTLKVTIENEGTFNLPRLK